ncbi:MAG: hypothetical protein HKN33_14560 [Pyrinomonadaceae bacterium]|nr:hypothetical protein [Pyrinomonadaceae bacterium]
MAYRRGRKVRGGVELGESADLELFLFDAKYARVAKDATKIFGSFGVSVFFATSAVMETGSSVPEDCYTAECTESAEVLNRAKFSLASFLLRREARRGAKDAIRYRFP